MCLRVAPLVCNCRHRSIGELVPQTDPAHGITPTTGPAVQVAAWGAAYMVGAGAVAEAPRAALNSDLEMAPSWLRSRALKAALAKVACAATGTACVATMVGTGDAWTVAKEADATVRGAAVVMTGAPTVVVTGAAYVVAAGAAYMVVEGTACIDCAATGIIICVVSGVPAPDTATACVATGSATTVGWTAATCRVTSCTCTMGTSLVTSWICTCGTSTILSTVWIWGTSTTFSTFWI
mmetsp:Transcript_103253/g.308443  ORF Transcript_103253/g.308443 Transcript_103253/m.308443 type:complete len:237 (+) Transcript_103253:31-741(+)